MASKITGQGILFIGILAVLGLYMFGQLMPEGDYTCVQSDLATSDQEAIHGCTSVNQVIHNVRQFQMPSNMKIDSMTMLVLKIIIIGLLVGLAYWVISRFIGHPMSRKDLFTLILIGVAVFFAWKYIGDSIFHAGTLEEIAANLGNKLGLFTP